MVPVDGTTLVDHWVFVLGGDQQVFDGVATLEVSLDAIPTTDLFDTFTKTLCVGYDYVPFVFTSWLAAWALLLPPSLTCLEDLLSLPSTLSKAHLGYMHLVRAFLR